MLRIAVAGASGRMGRMLIDAVDAAAEMTLSAALDRPDSAAIGSVVGTHGVTIGDDVDAALAASDVLIDFTRPEATLKHLDACFAHRTRLVIGTTGFDAGGIAAIEAASSRIGIVFAPNMSVGVNVLF
jgi:4-hydroxy-tetrahydrodipicolinate reductase